jgi:hypothetical protein
MFSRSSSRVIRNFKNTISVRKMGGGGHAPPVATEGFEGAVRKILPHDYQVNK